MKGCIVLQRRFAYVGHELANLLREKHGIEFSAYVHMREGCDYLKAQKDVPYTSIILDEDIQKSYTAEALDLDYLRAFEKKHDTLWSFINVDRVVRFGQLVREYPHNTSPYSHEEMLRIAQSYIRHLSDFLDKEQPDFVFAYQPGALGTMILYALAKERGIPTLTIVPPVTEGRIAVSERVDRLTGVEQLFKEYQKEKPEDIPLYAEALAHIRSFREKPVVYSNVYSSLVKHGTLKQFEFLMPRYISRTFTSLYMILKDWWLNPETRSDYTTIHPLPYLWDRTKRKLRNLRGVSDLYDEYERDAPFVFYPLHFEPELSVLMLAPFDTDQLAIVRRVAQSLPAGMLVYVKEHPQMTPFRPRRFYRELKKIPNVRLLRPEVSSFDIIKNSKLVTIITGTAGWEASVLGKPVITFGEVFYNALPSVKRSLTPTELPALIEGQLSGKVDDADLVRFVAALLQDTAKCDLLYLWEFEKDREKKREELSEFEELVARKIKLVTSGIHKKH